MKVKRKLITIDEELCNGCGQCVPGCAEGALQIIDGKARLVAEKFCDGLGACLGECPTGALTVREVDADDFDPDAVRNLLSGQGREIPENMPDPESLRLGRKISGGCPGSKVEKLTPCAEANKPARQKSAGGPSMLTHWPVKLRLVPPEASFLKGSDLLLTADCVAVSMPGYHERFLPGKTVLTGCPKFDDVELYVEKLSAIFAQCGLKSVTVLEMEVPCCSGMSRIVAAALKKAGVNIGVEKIIVAKTGEIKSRGSLEQSFL